MRVESAQPVNGALPVVYGVVVEGFGYTDVETPLHEVLGYDGEPGGNAGAPTRRTEIRLYSAAVLRHVPEEPLQPVSMGTVHLASDEDVAIALRMDAYLTPGANTGIPVGLYRSGATSSPVYLDADFLLGPEAAHLNISGVSGLATKTSAVEWLLASIFAHFPEKKGRVAAVCFNVKGPDLCFLDQPAAKLDDADRALYDRLGVPAEPFKDVEYFAPYTAEGLRAEHAAFERSARAQREAADVGTAGSAAVRGSTAQQGRRRREGRRADRFHQGARRRPGILGPEIPNRDASGAVVRRARALVSRSARAGWKNRTPSRGARTMSRRSEKFAIA